MNKLLFLLFLCISPVFAAPRDVTITLKTPAGVALPPNVTFHVFNDGQRVVGSQMRNGSGTVALEEGKYLLWLVPDEKTRIPGGIWRNMPVTGEGAQKWELTLPRYAAVQGKIVLADGKPASGYGVRVQTGSEFSPSFTFVVSMLHRIGGEAEAAKARGAQRAYSSTVTAADGTFTLSGLVPGNYALDVYEPQSKKWFTIPFAPAIKVDAEKGEPTKIGTWAVPENGWDWLFDNKLQREGRPTKFTGQGKVTTENGVVRLNVGDEMTGVTWDDKTLPRENYEMSFDARRVAGEDFFTGLTFPIADKYLSWIVGGWGGTVVGLSNIDGMAAVENETTQTREFELNRWYRLRLRVTKAKVEAWIDDDKLIDYPIAGKELSVRWSVEPSQPLGIATWNTGAELRDIRIRRLDAAEVTAIEKTVVQE